MERRRESSDRQLGLAIIAGLAVLAGAGAMLLWPGGRLAAAGFAVAVLAGLAVVGVVHLVPA